MAEIRRGTQNDNRVERLPWLEPVEAEEDFPRGGGRGWLVAGVALLTLVVVGILAAVLVARWRGQHQDLGGLIRAPATPYKTRPVNAGGLAVGTGDVVAEQTGTGADVDAPLALVAPEQPVAGAGARPAADDLPASPAQPRPATSVRNAPIVLAAPKPVVAPPPVAAGTPAPAPAAPVTGGGTVQLGAFSSEAKAKAAWKSLSHRFAYLQPMTVSIVPATRDGGTIYRLRASGGETAQQVCARLELAGEACAVVG